MEQKAFINEELEVEFLESGDKAILFKEFTYVVNNINYVVPVGLVWFDARRGVD